MIGVVLWSDPAERKAVFWCEDQADLAYFDASQDDAKVNGAFAAGDMVEFEIEVQRKFRKAINATLIVQKVCTNLQDKLRETAAQSSAARTSDRDSKVVPFRRTQVAGLTAPAKMKA